MTNNTDSRDRPPVPGAEAIAPLVGSGHQLITVLRHLTEGVALWDGGGTLRYANPAMRELFGDEQLPLGATGFDQFVNRLADSSGNRLVFSEPTAVKAVRAGRLARPVVVQVTGRHGMRRWLSFTAVPLLTDEPQAKQGMVSSVTDITELKLQSQLMAQLANYDTLTGAPNRRLLHDRMRQLLPQESRRGRQLAVCYLDLDGFKSVNDALGHEAGDELLKQAAGRLADEVRGGDTVARLGGDEFVVLLGDLQERGDCVPVIERILRSLAAPYQIGGAHVDGVSASIGVTVYPLDDSDPDTLLRHADKAMYLAKRAGKNTFRWFNPGGEERLAAQRETLREVRRAVRDRELVLFFQPIVDCRAGRVVGAEALLRWRHPILGILPPIQFLPLVEDNDLALEIGDFVMAEALRQAGIWHAAGHPLSVAVDLFARQLQQPDFVDRLRAALVASGKPEALRLDLEIAEKAALDAVTNIADQVARCRENGVGFSLDDFGTGYSTLDHLRRVPARTLKIDRTFIRDMLDDTEDRALVEAIIALGRSFRRDVVAVGVERVEQVRWLLAAGCDLMQGFYIAPPLPADAFMEWLEAFRADPAWTAP